MSRSDKQTDHELSTKEAILKVTLDLIKREGFEAVTIRKIASLAEVNVALVNYHFGSKDKLLNEAVKIIMNSFKNCFAVLEEQDLPPKEQLVRFLTDYVGAYAEYPELLRRLLVTGNIAFDSNYEFMTFVHTLGFPKVLVTLQKLTGETDQEKLMITAMQIMGALILPLLMEPIVTPATGLKLPEIQTQVKSLLNRFFTL